MTVNYNMILKMGIATLIKGQKPAYKDEKFPVIFTDVGTYHRFFPKVGCIDGLVADDYIEDFNQHYTFTEAKNYKEEIEPYADIQPTTTTKEKENITMNRQELIDKVMAYPKGEITHKDVERIVNGVFDEIKAAVAAGDTVQLVGFGTFGSKERAARTARNPLNGAIVNVPAKKSPTFKAGKAFKDAVNA